MAFVRKKPYNSLNALSKNLIVPGRVDIIEIGANIDGVLMFPSPGSSPSMSCREILIDIRQYLDDANRIFNRKEKIDQDGRDFYARSMVLFALSNRLIDLAREVIYIRGYAAPDEKLKNKVFMKRLHDHGVISSDLRTEMVLLVNFRNKVSHHFYDITRDDLVRVYNSLPQYLEFIEIMENQLSGKGVYQKKVLVAAGVLVLLLILLLIWYFS